MVIRHHVVGYENFCDFLKTFDTKNKLVHVYFTGSKLPSGESWCPDCNVAWPFVEEELEKLPQDSHFVVVEVGDRDTKFQARDSSLKKRRVVAVIGSPSPPFSISGWKDPSCPFRKDPKTKLMMVPTLIRWNSPRKLEGEQCEKQELLEMLFTYDEDD